MWELAHKEGWGLKNWCFWIVVLEKTLESPLDGKEIKPVNPKRNQPWIFIEGLMLKLQYFGHLMQRVDSLGKTLMLGNTENQCPWLRAGGEGGDRGSDGWMASLIQWIWANSRRQWRTGELGMLQSMGLQGVKCDLVTEQQPQQTVFMWISLCPNSLP